MNCENLEGSEIFGSYSVVVGVGERLLAAASLLAILASSETGEEAAHLGGRDESLGALSLSLA